MIAKALLPIILTIIFGDVCLYLLYLHKRRKRLLDVLWWLPGIALMGWACMLAGGRDFIPDDPEPTYLFLLLFALLALPKAIIAIFGGIGWLLQRWISPNLGLRTGIVMAVVEMFIVLWGSFVGVNQLEVKQVEMSFSDLPESFDGYRIVQFSDLHVGSLQGYRQNIIERMVDSINAQKADLAVFTGDLQNKQPAEITPFVSILKRIQAKDGVYSVMGNHDYTRYMQLDDDQQMMMMASRVHMDQMMGWKLLRNSRDFIHRGQQRLVVAGMDNDGDSIRFPQLGDVGMTLKGVSYRDFIIMLEHDPGSWRRNILKNCHAQLTLSGHTHGGQFSLLGWTPVSFVYTEPAGHYTVADRHIYVSKGVGGLVPFRFGAIGEIVVITLRRK